MPATNGLCSCCFVGWALRALRLVPPQLKARLRPEDAERSRRARSDKRPQALCRGVKGCSWLVVGTGINGLCAGAVVKPWPASDVAGIAHHRRRTSSHVLPRRGTNCRRCLVFVHLVNPSVSSPNAAKGSPQIASRFCQPWWTARTHRATGSKLTESGSEQDCAALRAVTG